MKKILYPMLAMMLAAFTFTSCEDVPAPYDIPSGDGGGSQTVVDEPKGSGTANDPYNSVAANEYIKTLEADKVSDKDIYVKGIVVSITENFDGDFGNATFYIADSENSKERFYAFRVLYLGNKKYTSGDLLKEGDEVVVCGKVINYKGNTPETQTNQAYIYSLNGKTEGGSQQTEGTPTGTGTKDDPYNSVAATKLAQSLESGQNSEDVYIKGKVVSIKENYGTQFGNASYYISDDGTTENQFYIFRSMYLNNEKYTSGDLLKVGDEVVVYGKVTNYMGNTPETVQNASYLVSLKSNGSSEGGETTTPDNGNLTVSKSANIVTIENPDAAGQTTVTCDLNNQGFEASKAPTEVILADGTTITFAQGEGHNSPIFHEKTKGVRMYAKNVMTVTGSKKIAKIVLTCDQYNTDIYVGNDELYADENGNIWTIVNDFTQNSGGTQLRVQTITITYAE